jgi:uncharacterized protein (DUF2267 family)
LSVEKESAQKIVSAVFRELHDRLTPKEAADAAAQTPAGLKRLWSASEFPGRKVRRIHKTEFIKQVAELAAIPEDEGARAVRVVFRALQTLLKSPTGLEGEAWDILSQLPKDLKKVWLDAARPQAAHRP